MFCLAHPSMRPCLSIHQPVSHRRFRQRESPAQPLFSVTEGRPAYQLNGPTQSLISVPQGKPASQTESPTRPLFSFREGKTAYQPDGPTRPLFLVREATPVYGSARDPHPVPLSVTADPDAFPRAVTPAPDPFTDADALEELEEEVVTLAAQIHAATHRLLSLIAEFDRRRGWELGGHRSAAHWLSFRTGIDLGGAREKVRAARALEELPQTRASMARGELSFSKIRALTRVATSENEGDLVELARGSTAAQLERMVRAFGRGTRKEEAELDRIRHDRRRLSVFPDEDGMYVVKGRLPAEIGALLMRAVDAASDALFRDEMEVDAASDALFRDEMEVDAASDALFRDEMEEMGRATVGGGPWPDEVESGTLRANTDSGKRAAQRRADAMGLLAERALAAGFENGPISGTRAARYQVVLHVEPETLRAEEESRDSERTPGRSELENGTRVTAETSRRISCDAGVVRVRLAPDGSLLDVGRRTRSIPPALRRALEIRDRGCRFPGCGSRFTDGHHVRHWADGGKTSLDNCVLLCHHHHRLVHEGGWRVDWWGRGRPVFFDPRGGTHFEGRWRPPVDDGGVTAETLIHECRGGGVVELRERPARAGEVEGDGPGATRMGDDRHLGMDPHDPVESLLRENRRRGIVPDGRTPSARWKREADIPEDLLFRAGEAMVG